MGRIQILSLAVIAVLAGCGTETDENGWGRGYEPLTTDFGDAVAVSWLDGDGADIQTLLSDGDDNDLLAEMTYLGAEGMVWFSLPDPGLTTVLAGMPVPTLEESNARAYELWTFNQTEPDAREVEYQLAVCCSCRGFSCSAAGCTADNRGQCWAICYQQCGPGSN